MSILRDTSIIFAILTSLVLFMMLQQSRYSVKVTNILTAAIMGPVVVWNVVFLILFGVEKAGQFILLNCVLPSLIFFLILAKKRDSRFLFTFCLVDTVVMWILLITNVIEKLAGLDNHVLMFVLRMVMYAATVVTVYCFCRKPYRYLQNELRTGWSVFAVSAFIFYLTLIIVGVFPTHIDNRVNDYPLLFVILFLLPLMYITIFYILWNQMQMHYVKEEKNYLDAWVRMAENRINDNAEMEKHLRIMRHDMRHHVVLLRDALVTGKYEKALEYVETIMGSIEGTVPKRYCENESVNVILSHYLKLAEAEGVVVSVDMRIPEKIVVGEIDFAVVLSNALENAIKAARACAGKQVELKGFIEDGKLFLEVKNPFVGTVEFDGVIPITRDENHGYGSRSIVRVVQKYGGVFSFVVEGQCFVFRCAM